MLVLARKIGETVEIGDHVAVTIVDIDRGKVRLGIAAPPEVMILRSELLERPDFVERPGDALAHHWDDGSRGGEG